MSNAAAILSRMQQSTRWTAGILTLVMLASAFVPIALGQSMRTVGMHCLRRKNVAPDKMPCHIAVAEDGMANDATMAEDAPSAVSSNENENDEPSLQSGAECCGNHDCCCRIGMSERERFLSPQFSSTALAFDRTTPSHDYFLDLKVVLERDSARAPPV